MKIATVDEMRQIEAAADASGHTYAAMMEQAGHGVAQAVSAEISARDSRVLVLVGPGNNGGDGLVAARRLAENQARVTCYLLKPRDPDDVNFQQVTKRDIDVLFAAEDADWRKLRQQVAKADVIIDALLGTGTRLPLRGTLAEMLRAVKRSMTVDQRTRSKITRPASPASAKPDRPLIVAVDGPTGLAYDSGALDQSAIPADITVTFAHPKVGHFRFPGAEAVGRLLIVDIGTDPALAANIQLAVVTPEMVRRWLPPRPQDAHKGTFGRALIVAGSMMYTGAAYLAGSAATRAGAGLVTLALPQAIHGAIAGRLAEATYLPLPHDDGFVAARAADKLTEQATAYDALLIGPGLGQRQTTQQFLKALLKKGKLQPLVIDADGLNMLAKMDNWPQMLPPQTILTPHPGEMARLMGSTIDQVQADRVTVARSQAEAWQQTVILKGAYTVVAAPDGQTTVIEPFANAGLATAGTGDVLAGAVVALRAQGLGAFQAAAAGAYVHGLAGQHAKRNQGAIGMVAGDVLAHLPQAMRAISGT